MKFERNQLHLNNEQKPTLWMYQYLSDLIRTANSLSSSSVSVTSNNITSSSGTLNVNTSGLVNFNDLRIDFTHSNEPGVLVANSEDYASFQPLQWLGHKTGELFPTLRTTAPTGWIMAQDGTIGDVGSGASVRAHQDCISLYAKLWQKYTNSQLAVSGGRGENASNDFAAGKTIELPSITGRVVACSGSGASLTIRTDYELVGSSTHTITTDELAKHWHSPINEPGAGTAYVGSVDPYGADESFNYTSDRSVENAVAFDLTANVGDQSRSNIENTLYINFMIKL